MRTTGVRAAVSVMAWPMIGCGWTRAQGASATAPAGQTILERPSRAYSVIAELRSR